MKAQVSTAKKSLQGEKRKLHTEAFSELSTLNVVIEKELLLYTQEEFLEEFGIAVKDLPPSEVHMEEIPQQEGRTHGWSVLCTKVWGYFSRSDPKLA